MFFLDLFNNICFLNLILYFLGIPGKYVLFALARII